MPRLLDFMVLTPAGTPDPALAIAGSRAGALGVLNLEFANDKPTSFAALARLASHGQGRLGILLNGGEEDLLADILAMSAPDLGVIILARVTPDRLRSLV